MFLTKEELRLIYMVRKSKTVHDEVISIIDNHS